MGVQDSKYGETDRMTEADIPKLRAPTFHSTLLEWTFASHLLASDQDSGSPSYPKSGNFVLAHIPNSMAELIRDLHPRLLPLPHPMIFCPSL
jgi:hypothetical protein